MENHKPHEVFYAVIAPSALGVKNEKPPLYILETPVVQAKDYGLQKRRAQALRDERGDVRLCLVIPLEPEAEEPVKAPPGLTFGQKR
jgi:hypothetical protein